MQLILTPPRTEDIQLKMSAQTESPVNQTYKIDSETIAALENNLSNELPTSEISNDIVFLQEKIQDGPKTNDTEIGIAEDNLNKDDYLESTKNIVSETILNGTNCALNIVEVERKIQYLETINENEIIISKTTDSELCLLNNSNLNLESLTKNEKSVLANVDEPVLEKDITSLKQSKDLSEPFDTCALAYSPENSNNKHDNSLIAIEINNASQVVENITNPETEKNKNETKHVDSSSINETKYSDDVEMIQEIQKHSEVYFDIATTNESNTMLDRSRSDNKDVATQEINANANDVLTTKTLKPLIMDEDILLPNHTSKTMLPEREDSNPVETVEKEYLPVQVSENISPENKNVKPLEMAVKESLSIQPCENMISGETKDAVNIDKESISNQTVKNVEPKPMDEEKICVHLNTDENALTANSENLEVNRMGEDVLSDKDLILPNPDEAISLVITEELLPSDLNVDNSITTYENKKVINSSILESMVTSSYVAVKNADKLLDDTSRMTNFQEIDTTFVHCTKNYDEKQVLDDKENIDNITNAMEIDDIQINNLKQGDNISNEVINNSDILNSTKPEGMSEIAAEQLAENVITKKDLKGETAEDNKTELEGSSDTVLENNLAENMFPSENLSSLNTHVTVENKDLSNISKENPQELTKDPENEEVLEEDDIKIVDLDEDSTNIQEKEICPEQQETNSLPVVCKLSNTLDILSDDEEEVPKEPTKISDKNPEEKQCIDLDDDDDIMLIEEDVNSKEKPEVLSNKQDTEQKLNDKVDEETGEKQTTNVTDLAPNINEKEKSPDNTSNMEIDTVKPEDTPGFDDKVLEKPLLPQNVLKTAKKNLASMTRHELEDFCILRIVESIVDRSNLSDIKTKMKTMAQNLEDYKKRALMMTKQNRDLQVVLKSVQEEQKKRTNVPIQPLKITRSVGMQVLMNDKLDPRRKAPIPNPVQPPSTGPTCRPVRGTQTVKMVKPPAAPVNIPVPRKVPVNNSPSKPNTPANNVGNKSSSPNPNGLRNPSPVQKMPEKRTHSRIQATSVTVDLTDDEPPAKINNRTSPAPPVRVVPSQNLMAQPRQFPPINNNARKVYIPISGPAAQQMRPGQTYVMKTMANQGPRPAQRLPIPRPQQQTPMRPKHPPNRHPAPLPESMKQYTPSTWKALPPAPDLKLSKVENGIVISWKIDGYPDGGYETIASYQLYAYQETTAPPCTALWKKIGDVKALPLPMACTLTQFMAGFKYYFAVRAVDIRSRLGPFSLPGSILLLNKV